MSIKKKYFKNGTICKVTFLVSEKEFDDISIIKVVGEFNNWNTKCKPMKRDGKGHFKKSFMLQSKCEYQFKYFIDDTFWELEPDADKYVHNGFGPDEYNSVVII